MTEKFVVDTNVAIAANGRDTHASLPCQFACIGRLQEISSSKSKSQVLLDELGLILAEYSSYLYYRGQPGVGDSFYKFLHDNIYSGGKVSRVAITPSDDESRGFEEIPSNELDRSDRKFLAVAKVGNASIVNALDTDWHIHLEFVSSQGVHVEQLCPELGCLLKE